MNRGQTISKLAKQEISPPPQKQCCRRSRFSALLRTAGSIIVDSDGLKVQLATDNPAVSEFAAAYAFEKYGCDVAIKKGKHICVRLSGSQITRLLAESGILASESGGYGMEGGIPNYVVKGSCCIKEYVKGAFLGCGFISSDIRHFEFAFTSGGVAKEFVGLLESVFPSPGFISRGDKTVIYYKNKTTICDILNYMDAQATALDVTNIIARGDFQRKAMLESNCDMANIDRSLRASEAQLAAIETVDQKLGIENLDDRLQTMANLRRAYPSYTLEDLAKVAGATKSCVRHRLDKLIELSRTLTIN